MTPRSPYDVSYEGAFYFAIEREELWSALAQTHLFEQWWPWIGDVRLEGEPLAEGSAISFVIDPPIPYRLRVTVDVERSQWPSLLSGTVSGDLSGSASLRFVDVEEGTRAETKWDVEVANRALRAAIRIAGPLLRWAQRWAVEVSLRGFRRHLQSQRP